MHHELLQLINDYKAAVAEAVERLHAELEIPKPQSEAQWVTNQIPQTGTLPSGIRYFKHGYGCCVALPGKPVDFDFGAGGRYDGFDPYRLYRFMVATKAQGSISSEAEFWKLVERGLSDGEIIKSDYILYYLAADA